MPIVSLVMKRPFGQTYKNHKKYYENDCLKNFLLRFISLLIAKFVKKIHILARIYFILLKKVLEQTWLSFNTKFGPQWKD